MDFKTTTIEEAYRESCTRGSFPYGTDGQFFTLVGWQSPSSGRISGPFLVTISGNQCIEIGWDGTFKKAYPAAAQYYFSWFKSDGLKERAEKLKEMAQSALEKTQ